MWVGTGVWCADALEVGNGVGKIGTGVGFEAVDDYFRIIGGGAEALCVGVVFAVGYQVEPGV